MFLERSGLGFAPVVGVEPNLRGAVVGTGRFELPTCRLGGGRSIQLSYVPRPANSIVSGTPPLQTLLGDVATVVHAVEFDLFHGSVGGGDGGGQIRAGRSDT
jgi:hypothetical protein